MEQSYPFVGGPYDGRNLTVPGPTQVGLELRVYPVEPWVPGASYLLDEKGYFRYASGGPASGGPQEAADRPRQAHESADAH